MLGVSGFADTNELRNFFDDPHLVSCDGWTRRLSFLGGKYDQRLSELRSGMIYLSEQMALPEERRFANTPEFHTLLIDGSDHSDPGIGKAAGDLILTLRGQL